MCCVVLCCVRSCVSVVLFGLCVLCLACCFVSVRVLVRDSVLLFCSVVVSLYVFGLFDVCVDVLMHALFVHYIRCACFGCVVFLCCVGVLFLVC